MTSDRSGSSHRARSEGIAESRGSSHWGAFRVRTRPGEAPELVADPDDPDPSPLLPGLLDEWRSSSRVLRPAVRRGWLEQDPARDHRLGRGREDFIEVTWETALDLVADELRHTYADYGPSAVFGGSYGWASAGRFHHPKGQLNRMLGLLGGFVQQDGNYSYGAGMTILPHVLGSYGPVAGQVPMWEDVVANTEVILLFGGMPMGNSQVNPGGVGRHQTRSWVHKLKAKGVEITHIGPRRTDMPEELRDAEWLPIKPNTDTALMLALAHELVVSDRVDLDFLTRCCVGYDQLKSYILGVEDGIAKDPRWAAQITGLTPGQITQLADRLAGRRVLISVTWAIQRARFGEQPYWMAVALSAMLGQLGLPGGGVGFGYGNISSTGERRSSIGGPTLPSVPNPCSVFIPVARFADMLLHPGAAYQYNGRTLTYPDVRTVYWGGGNPFHHIQDLNRLARAWRKPETIIVHETVWTSTARRADIVLPSTTALERNDLGFGKSDRYLIAMRASLEPPGLGLSDFEILRRVAGRLGVEEEFTQGREEMDWLEFMYDQVRVRASLRDIEMPSFTEFWDGEGIIALPTQQEDGVPFADFRSDPSARPLNTPSSRIELYSTTVAGFGYDDCPGHPSWLAPEEYLGAEVARRFPLHLLSHQPRVRLHSQHDFSRLSQKAKVHGRESCRLSPSDAHARGIEDGDLVRIYNDRGACLSGAILDPELRPGVIMLATGAWYDPDESGMDKHGNPNVLTSDLPTSRLSQGPAPQSALVEVERFDHEPPDVTAFGQPSFYRPLEAADSDTEGPWHG